MVQGPKADACRNEPPGRNGRSAPARCFSARVPRPQNVAASGSHDICVGGKHHGNADSGSLDRCSRGVPECSWCWRPREGLLRSPAKKSS